MTFSILFRHPSAVFGALLGVAMVGCHTCTARMLYEPPPAVAPLGSISDAVWQSQEARAEASEFVIYQHEFEYGTARLNFCGENHVTQLAARLMYCPRIPVVIERSMMSVKPGTEYEYAVHPNPDLDLDRREVVVRALTAMGVPDAEHRVLVAPAYAEGFEATEALQVYQQALSGQIGFGFGGGLGGFGSAFGGGFGFGGFGGFQ